MLQHVFLTERAGKVARIPYKRPAESVIDLSAYWTERQAEVRRTVARNIHDISTALETTRDAIRTAVAHRLLEEALDALEELTRCTFGGADEAAPIVRTCFSARRREIVQEMYDLICRAYEQQTGVCVPRPEQQRA
ncbi:hypothetical protein SAMN06265338_10811 [Rhodoblastus acidophilus]|uniref:Uncharacterized protein n=1 Tax=Rhodoblastus acidophilus TaxID=1074 RepID=A0A212RVH3_RHOAC|nr:hypothetical protein [Rhodoblastus acidophilus]PPQ35533.1 hypothetical protein CKO16_20425 [Rhodoblastus acidophilus]RAI18858.1 hypothetical protein CH337_13110 [Rhodoblastus acidophilus]SNB76748.1 hypothetical protein SAMN06265338_10811 [Rhodoblastus acidophilus]